MEKRRAIYPGSFDPLTYGHLDLIKRAQALFDELYVVVAVNSEKKTLFTLDERMEMVRNAVESFDNVIVDADEGLIINYAKEKNAQCLLRGLRATSDFDYEFQMALTNRNLSQEVETMFLMPSQSHFYLSSRLIKEIASLGGEISQYVPEFVAEKIKAVYAK